MRIEKTYHFDFDHPVDRLWAVVSDTPRWGEATGFPKYRGREELLDDGRVRIIGEVRLAGYNLCWEEPPGNWVANHWFEQVRNFSSGPIARMVTVARLEDRGDTSGLELELRFESSSLIGSLLAKRLVGAYEPKVRELLDTADRLIRAEQPDLFVTPYRPSEAALERGKMLSAEIAETPYEHGLAPRLVEFIHDSQEVDLWSMRPIAIARRWHVAAQQVIELFLQAVRSGLLESRWDILCPRCRVSMSPVANMGDLPDGVHCNACNIDYDADFARNVELCFSPSPSIRAIENGFYCRSGPGVTPHVKAQCTLAPGERRGLPLMLAPGLYRARTLEAGDEVGLEWTQGPFPRIRVEHEQVTLVGDSAPGEIELENGGTVTRTLVIEQQDWLRDVLTAEQVTTLQAFRDLFSDQVLRPGDEVSIRNICFMFTDLVGSSEMFNRVGDAAAYHLVREHFAEMAEIVRSHRGNIVKTVGDGIHAAFLQPDDALRAALGMQASMPAFRQRLGCIDIDMRIGLHSGSSIAVTLNERLDYYGEAVNLAARLERHCPAGGITLSQDFADDPAVAALLADYAPREQSIEVKGFARPVGVLQLEPVAAA